ncbi:hypothetical protein [Lacticaseibacillus saniviri]|uniref:hypothetical protein n=1 Tax=Lacticaseibacillus saniviri TaxID=931533 RepID=UPI00138F700A|nr:hypothetical protein [Lacticaseibacillus saniviri]
MPYSIAPFVAQIVAQILPFKIYFPNLGNEWATLWNILHFVESSKNRQSLATKVVEWCLDLT